MRGWFDAFRTEGGPTLYSYSNRTPVTGDPPTIALYVLFATLGIAFVIIFPGIRKERLTTFSSVALSLFVGLAILVSKYGSAWHVAETEITTAYRAFSREKVTATIGVHIGLTHFNVTLQGIPESNETTTAEDIDFNERFYWAEADAIQQELRLALQKGLPYPILTVVEYFSLDDEGFSWGRDYRHGGYYAGILLWACFASWVLMNLLIVVVPRYGAYQMVLTGGLLLITDAMYWALIPRKPPLIRFEEHVLIFRLGTSFWIVLIAGGCCVAAGSLIAILDLIFPHTFSTILEVDYDTPYDRHIIIEESHDTRKKKGRRSLEDPDGIGKRILRTLSKRSTKGEDESLDVRLQGHPNEGFQMDPPVPNSPWRYPHQFQFPPVRDQNLQLRGALASAFAKNPALMRLAAPNPKSPKAVSFRRQSRLETTYTVEDRRKDSSSSSDLPHEEPPPPPPLTFQSQFRGIQRKESTESRNSSLSSYGLGLLSRQPSSQMMNVHQPLSNGGRKKSNNSSRHAPLQRVNQYPRTIELPRAAIDRKSSTEDSRRDSASSNASAASSSSTNYKGGLDGGGGARDDW